MTKAAGCTAERPLLAGREGRIGHWLLSLLLYSLWTAWTLFGLLLAPLTWLVLKALTHRPTDQVIRRMIWLYGRGWLALGFPFVRFRRQGFDGQLPWPCIYVVNHLSYFDTYCMGLLPQSNIAFAVRSWPFRRLFWYRHMMRLAGYLAVEEQHWARTLEQGREVVASGGSLLFFPEGHRSRDGRLQRFYNGAFSLAVKLNVPIVPLCLTGTDQLLPPGRRLLRPARVTLRALPALNPADFPGETGHTDLRKAVKAEMAQALAEMSAAGGRL